MIEPDYRTLGKRCIDQPVTSGVSVMAYEAQEAAISAAMNDPVLSAEEQLERKCDWLIRELDEITALSANPETVDLVEGQQLAIGQINTRVTLILSFLATRKPRLTVVSNNG